MKPSLMPYVAVFFAAFAWALSPIFMRWLSGAYDPYTQSLARYLSSTLVLLPYSLAFYPAETKRLFRRPLPYAGLALINIVMMTLWTIACYHTTATNANLITKLQVAFVIFFSFIFFREERSVIRHPLYGAGTLLGILGVVAIASGQNAATALPGSHLATIFLIIVSLGWAVYAVWGKHLVMGTDPVPMFAVISTLSTLGFIVVALLAGDISTLWRASPMDTFTVFCSGMFPIAIAHCTFHYAQKKLGAAFTTSITLIGPLITYIIALFIWPDERLTTVQWAGAGGLLLGSYWVVRAQRKTAARMLAPPE